MSKAVKIVVSNLVVKESYDSKVELVEHGSDKILGVNAVACLSPLCETPCDWCEDLRNRCKSRRFA